MLFDSSGDLFVSNSGNGTVSEFAALPSTATGAYSGGLDLPDALIFDSQGDLFVADDGNNTINEFAAGGVTTTPTAVLAGGLNGPQAMAFDSHGDLFVANTGGTTVSEFAPSGTTPIATLALPGIPTALACDSSGNLFVGLNTNNGLGGIVEMFAPDATTASAILQAGNADVRSLAFDKHGNLYAGAESYDSDNGAISYFDTVAEFTPGATEPTAVLTGIGIPDALAFDSNDNLYVANGGYIIAGFPNVIAGTTISEFAPGSTTPTATLTGLNSPDALAFDARGDLYAANYNYPGTISEFAPGADPQRHLYGSLSNRAGFRPAHQQLSGRRRHSRARCRVCRGDRDWPRAADAHDHWKPK